MEEPKNDYHFSFFKPTTAHARANRNMVIWFVLIWAVAIFGFQLALYVLQKPTPEPVLKQFQAVWTQVQNDTATSEELQDYSYTCLSVLGKVFIDTGYRKVLDRSLSRSVIQLTDSTNREKVILAIDKFTGIVADIDNATTKIDAIEEDDNLKSAEKKSKKEPYQKEIDAAWDKYPAAKEDLVELISPILGLEKTDVRTRILPLELTNKYEKPLSDKEKKKIEEAMDLYLVHNQSVLTDTKFLGFPFHYFYTAIFLLILFVGLCWLYCVRTDRINKKLNIAD